MDRVIIIGGGILGASTAYHLAKANIDVLLVDRKDKGQATDAAAGIICPWLSQRRNKAWYALAKGGAAYYSTLIEKLKQDGEIETGYRKVGAISLHTDLEKLEKMKNRALERRETASEIGGVHKLDVTATEGMFPALSPEYSSIHVEGAARVDGRALRDALIRAAQKHGAQLLEGSAKFSLEGKKVNGVYVDNELYLAEKVIVTAGAWAGELFAPLGFNLQVTGQKAQILHLRIEDEDTAHWPVVIPPNDQYILAFEDGKIVVGATHEDNKGFDDRPTAVGIHEVLDKALRIAPGLSESTFEEVRVGIRPFTPGFLPIIGPVPEHPEVLFANGLGASGLTVGPYLGKQLSNMIQEQEMEIELALYKVDDAFSKN